MVHKEPNCAKLTKKWGLGALPPDPWGVQCVCTEAHPLKMRFLRSQIAFYLICNYAMSLDDEFASEYFGEGPY